MSTDVFISYSTEDQNYADAVCEVLERSGVRCWIAPRDVMPGAEWDESILEAIEKAQVFVLILSARANESPFVKTEVNRAFANRKTIVTFRVEDVLPGRSLELYLARHHWTDGFPPPLAARVDRLAAAVQALLGNSPSTAPTARPAAAAVDTGKVSSPANAEAPREPHHELVWDGPRLTSPGSAFFCIRVVREKRQPLAAYYQSPHTRNLIVFELVDPLAKFSGYVTFDGHIIHSVTDPGNARISIALRQELETGALYKCGFHVEDGNALLKRAAIISNTHVIEMVLPCRGD